MSYNHLDIFLSQTAKHEGAPCGDAALWERGPSATLVVLADGLGHGVKAHVMAHMFVARLSELYRRGASVREAFRRVATTINANRLNDGPYAAFGLVRVRSDGESTVLTYDLPPPILLGKQTASVLKGRSLLLGDAVATETTCFLEPGEGLLLVSDGVTQAGLGTGLRYGWTIEGVEKTLQAAVSDRVGPADLARLVHDEARGHWGRVQGDDCSALVARLRRGKVVHLMTGPPQKRSQDYEVVRNFMSAEGTHVLCGGSTAAMAARVLNRPLRVKQDTEGWSAPPQYYIEGVDLATEGVVTLTQVCRILNEDPDLYEATGIVSRLARLLREADKVELTVGLASNPASADISFAQQGILPRTTLVEMLRDILEKQGKLVVVNRC